VRRRAQILPFLLLGGRFVACAPARRAITTFRTLGCPRTPQQPTPPPPAPRPPVPADWIVRLPSAATSPTRTSPADPIGVRGLAWLGGIATALGIVFLLALAISRAWIGEELRTVLAGLGSVALIAAGTWLHEHRGRTEAAIAMVGAGTVGAFATMLVAGDVYHLLDPAIALAGALLAGAPILHAAAIALGAIAIALVALGRSTKDDELKRLAWTGAATTLLYIVSVAIVTAFQPTAGGASATVLDLSVRQQGQVVLSVLWSVLGFAGLIVGLCRKLSTVRLAGLGLLLAVAKVFLYDLSTLTSIYRVISFIVLGLLLLTGAFCYQRAER
jgi:uncharacterized membrane protein